MDLRFCKKSATWHCWNDFESRPNVTIDAFSLCFKTGNSVLLRGGSDAIYSNMVLVEIIKENLLSAKITDGAVELLSDTSHAEAEKMMQADKFLDVLIPRGSARLINRVKEKATVPVIETGVGNCTIFVDESADLEMATKIVINAKTQRPSVCNAAESLVVHAKIADEFLPKLENEINKVHEIEFRADERALKVLSAGIPATDDDFGTEFLDYILSVKRLIIWMKQLSTLILIQVVIQKALSLMIISMRKNFKMKLMRQPFMSMRLQDLLTVLYLA